MPAKRRSSRGALPRSATARRPTKERLEAALSCVSRWARRKYPGLPKLKLLVPCPQVARVRRGGDRRVYFASHADNRTIGTVAAAAKLPPENLVGILLHELGHVIARKEWGKSEEPDADRAAKKFLGVRIRYKGPLLLQWVPRAAAERILRC